MTRPSKTDQEIGLLRSFWDTVKMMENDYHGMVSMYSFCTHRPGVVNIRLAFTPLMGGEENELAKAAVAIVFPNSQRMSLAGALFKAAFTLQQMVEDIAEEQKARTLQRG